MDGTEIRRLRERNGWSQSDLAAAVNASIGRSYNPSSISAWENGRRPAPAAVAAFMQQLATELGFDDDEQEPSQRPRPKPTAPDVAPRGAEETPPSGQPAIGGGGAWARACEELWELVATGVGMVGAATGNDALVRDGAIIAADKQALGAAWGKLAETNETFRRMLAGMTEGGVWLQVALVTGTTVSKCWGNHARYSLAPAEAQPQAYEFDAAA